MPKSQQQVLSKQDSQRLLAQFFQVVGDLRDPQESHTFLTDFLTDSEQLTFAKRLAIAIELEAGKSYDAIRKQYGVSSATISTVAELMRTAGMKLALKKIANEKWSTQMSDKFFNLFALKAEI